MASRLPIRFSIRTMLTFVALVAFAAFAIRDHVLLSEARHRFDAVESRWLTSQLSDEDYVEASEALMSAESESLWITRNAAHGKHALHLLRLSQWLDSLSNERGPESSEKARELIYKSGERLLNR
jgi:hypothetical protein